MSLVLLYVDKTGTQAEQHPTPSFSLTSSQTSLLVHSNSIISSLMGLCLPAVESGEPAEQGTKDGARRRRLAAQLQRKLDQHKMSNKPFALCRMNPAEPHGDTSLLDAFAVEARTQG